MEFNGLHHHHHRHQQHLQQQQQHEQPPPQQQQQQQQQQQRLDDGPSLSTDDPMISPPPAPPAPSKSWNPSPHPIKICRVCGERALGFNFGGLCCESCKAFFRRSVFSVTKKPACINNGQCEINMQTRRICSACRFQKCIAIGMKVERLLSKKRLSKSRKNNAHPPPSPPLATVEVVRPLSPFETACLKAVSEAIGCILDPFVIPLIEGEVSSMLEAFEKTPIYARQFIEFAKCFPAFCELQPCDQVVVIKKSFPSHIVIRISITLDDELGYIFFVDEECKQNLRLRVNTLGLVMDEAKLSECLVYCRMYRKELKDDRTLQGLFYLLQLFKPNGSESCGDFLTYYYNFYRYLLRRYLLTKYEHHHEGARKFQRIMGELSQKLKRHVEIFFSDLVYKLDFQKLNQLAMEMYSCYN